MVIRIIQTTEQLSSSRGGGKVSRGRRNGPFRFEARWLKEEGCDEVVEKAWKDSWAGGALGVSAALKSVASNLQEWDDDVVGDLPKRIRETKKELDKCMRSPICQGKVTEEVRLRCKLDLLEEIHNIK
jgi:hypothetical protein